MQIELSQLYNYYFEISDIFVVKQMSDKKTSTDMSKYPRSTDALLLFESGTAICYQKNCEPLFVPQGSLVYMPKGSRYLWENSLSEEEGKQERTLFEFTLKLKNLKKSQDEKSAITPEITNESIHFADKVTVISTEHTSFYKEFFSSLNDAFSSNEQSPLSIYSIAYEIFRTLSGNCRQKHLTGQNAEIIEAGIKHMENSENYKISIKEIADMCGVSVCYFEKLFKANFGITPTEYINSHRMYKIKKYLREDQLTLSEIAELFDFCDSGYLCRFFKKKTGMTPKEYKRLCNIQNILFS